MHTIIEQYKDTIIPIAAWSAVMVIFGACCSVYADAIEHFLEQIMFK